MFLGLKMKFVLDSRDVKMGNEDEWTLIISDDKSEAYIQHWWSHRDGSIFNFKSDTKNISLNDFKSESPRLYQKAIDILNAEGFSELITN
jgi:hypothetical protein